MAGLKEGGLFHRNLKYIVSKGKGRFLFSQDPKTGKWDAMEGERVYHFQSTTIFGVVNKLAALLRKEEKDAKVTARALVKEEG